MEIKQELYIATVITAANLQVLNSNLFSSWIFNLLCSLCTECFPFFSLANPTLPLTLYEISLLQSLLTQFSLEHNLFAFLIWTVFGSLTGQKQYLLENIYLILQSCFLAIWHSIRNVKENNKYLTNKQMNKWCMAYCLPISTSSHPLV